MPDLAEIREEAFTARARLLAFEQLLRLGVNVYVPIAQSEGIDGLVRREDGSSYGIVVRPSGTEHFPLRFQARNVDPNDSLFVVCVAWALSPMQFWVLPSVEFVRRAERLPDGWFDLDLESVDPATGKKHKIDLGFFRNAWRLLTDGAVKSLVAY